MENSTKKEVKLFEAFAGIGAQRRALENISKKMGWDIKPVGQIEWYINAMIGYQLIHGDFNELERNVNLSKYNISSNSKVCCKKEAKEKIAKTDKNKYISSSIVNSNNLVDISKVKGANIPKNIDIFTYSFPCQDLSIQGKQKGMNKTAKTRSSLLWQVERLLKEASKTFDEKEMPKYLLMENVPSITNTKNIRAFRRWINTLNKLNYESKYYTLDSSDFGSAQKRKRVFCLSVRKEYMKEKDIVLPDAFIQRQQKKVKDILNSKNKNLDKLSKLKEKYNIKFNQIDPKKINEITLHGYTKFNSENYLYNSEGLGPTLTASGANSRIKLAIDDEIRYMEADECLRYMGFTNDDYKKMIESGLMSNSNIIFLAGNSIPVEVLEAIFERMVF